MVTPYHKALYVLEFERYLKDCVYVPVSLPERGDQDCYRVNLISKLDNPSVGRNGLLFSLNNSWLDGRGP